MAAHGVCLLYVYGIPDQVGFTVQAVFVSGLAAYLLYYGIYANIRCRVWYDTDTLRKEVIDLRKERKITTNIYKNLLRHFHRERFLQEAEINYKLRIENWLRPINNYES